MGIDSTRMGEIEGTGHTDTVVVGSAALYNYAAGDAARVDFGDRGQYTQGLLALDIRVSASAFLEAASSEPALRQFHREAGPMDKARPGEFGSGGNHWPRPAGPQQSTLVGILEVPTPGGSLLLSSASKRMPTMLFARLIRNGNASESKRVYVVSAEEAETEQPRNVHAEMVWTDKIEPGCNGAG